MAQLAKTHRDQLDRLKNNVELSMSAQRNNIERYWKSRDFVYRSSMSDDEINAANDLDRPTLESNILEPYISRQVGEISKQLPDPRVEPKIPDDASMASQAEVVENHIRHIFDKARDIRIAAYENSISGGFYVFKVCTDYIREDKFEQSIFIREVDDVTKCGFDPLAKKSHKADGRYCYEMIPKTKEEFEEEFPGVKIDDVNYLDQDKTWFYYNEEMGEKQKIIMICNYYEKKYTYKPMVWVSNPTHPDSLISMFVDGKDGYDETVEKMLTNGFTMGEIPQIVKKGKRKICNIINYQFTGKQVLSQEELDYKYFPLVNCDGNSKRLRKEVMTKPLVYQAMDSQKAKNMAFQAILNDMENRGQTDEYLPIAGLPTKDEFKLAWIETQKKHIAKFYNHVDENGNPINPPMKIPAVPLDSTMIQFYEIMSNSCQQSLGSYDTQQGVQSNNMSGIAIQNGATQSNNSSMPYINNFMESWSQAARVCVDLMPKYMTTLMSIPVIDRDGKASYVIINNSKGNPTYKLEYAEDDMDVDVKMDLSFEMQKQVALQNIETAAKMSPDAQQFFGGPGFHFVLDNMSFRDVAKVKEEFSEFQKNKANNQKTVMDMKMKTDPVVAQTNIAQMKMQSEEKDRKLDLIKTIADIKIQERKAELEEAKVQATILESRDKLVVEAMQVNAENNRSDAETAMALDKHAYEKIESKRNHALKVRDSDRGHVLDLVQAIGDVKNANSKEQKANEEKRQADEEGVLE